MIEHGKKMLYYLWSLYHGSIHLSLLFGAVVNNEQNTHGLVSSFPSSVSASHAGSLSDSSPDDASEISVSLCLPPPSDKCTHQLRPRGQPL